MENGTVYYPKTVFISYRRNISQYQAISIYLALTQRGYDVFFDIDSIDSGNFLSTIFDHIQQKEHFILLLAPGTLNNINEPEDILAKEIEWAIKHNRNIVPIFLNDFNISAEGKKLSGNLNNLLNDYNGLKFYPEYFEAGINKLTERFLKVPKTISPPSKKDAEPTDYQNDISEKIKSIMKKTLAQPIIFPQDSTITTAQKYFNIIKKYEGAHIATIDLCGKIDSILEPTIICLAGFNYSDSIIISPEQKRNLIKHYTEKFPKIKKLRIYIKILSDLFFTLINRNTHIYSEFFIDNEYIGYEKDIKGQICNWLIKFKIFDIKIDIKNLKKPSIPYKKARYLHKLNSKGIISINDLGKIYKKVESHST